MMQEISMDLLTDVDDAALERIAREYPMQADEALFERAYQGYLQQSGCGKAPKSGAKRHWIQVVSVAACCLLIVGAACLWRIPPHPLPTLPETTEPPSETGTVPITTEVTAETETHDAASTSPTEQPTPDPTEPTISQTEPPTQPVTQAIVPAETAPVTQVPVIATEPPAESHAPEPTTTETPSMPTEPELLPGFDVLQHDIITEVICRDETAPSPEELRDYRLDSDQFWIEDTLSPESPTPVRIYQIGTSEPERILVVKQQWRECFSVSFTEEATLYPAEVGEYPAFFACFADHTILLWDDGQYQFSVEDSCNDMTTMQEIAKAFVQTNPD